MIKDLRHATPATELDDRHVEAGHAAHIQGFLTDAGLRVTLFDRVAENPTSTLVTECAAFARDAG